MHHQRSSHSLRLLRRGAYHFLFNVVLGISAVCAIGYSVYHNNEIWLYMSLGLLAFWLISLFTFFIKASNLRCSLCMSPLWLSRKCQRPKNVKPALGISYRLGLALAVVFKGNYSCHYCGESFSAKKARGSKRGEK